MYSPNKKPTSLITNFEISLFDVYNKTINDFSQIIPNHGLFIYEKGFDCYNRQLPNYMALHCANEIIDLSKFWKLFDINKKALLNN